jgi:hypothetical protein
VWACVCVCGGGGVPAHVPEQHEPMLRPSACAHLALVPGQRLQVLQECLGAQRPARLAQRRLSGRNRRARGPHDGLLLLARQPVALLQLLAVQGRRLAHLGQRHCMQGEAGMPGLLLDGVPISRGACPPCCCRSCSCCCCCCCCGSLRNPSARPGSVRLQPHHLLQHSCQAVLLRPLLVHQHHSQH